MQWGIYCNASPGAEPKQLAHTDRFMGSSEWSDFHQAVVVPNDCPVQILRLELANPRRDANVAGNVAIRIRGGLWFDDMRMRRVD